MLKAFIGKPLSQAPLIELIRPNFGIVTMPRWAERHVELKETIIEIAAKPEGADFLLVPHNFGLVKDNKPFLAFYEDLSLRLNKKIVIFFPGDSDEEVKVKNSIVFRNSAYKSEMKANELIMPGYTEDLAAGTIPKQRYKTTNIPVVGFCGWADFDSFLEALKFKIKSKRLFLRSLGDKKLLTKQKGLWWRRRALRKLGRSGKVKTNFIIRPTYSGNEKTISLDPDRARREFVENVRNSDFTLATKGDGNFSTRFYEVLSLGRIPLFLDTDCALPLEDVIDYDSFMVRVDWKDARHIAKKVSEFYQKTPAELFMEMQIEARQAFEKYLRLDSYLRYVVEHIIPKRIA